jgi:hypothetical protein
MSIITLIVTILKQLPTLADLLRLILKEYDKTIDQKNIDAYQKADNDVDDAINNIRNGGMQDHNNIK